MSNDGNALERLRRLNLRVGTRDARALEEGRALAARTAREEGLGDSPFDAMAEESIVRRALRPVLAIAKNEVSLEFREEDDSATWKERLVRAAALLNLVIPAVGRVDTPELPGLPWVGTAWLVAEDVLVTNRHVAAKFVQRRGDAFAFVDVAGSGRLSPRIDFFHEADSDARAPFRLLEVLDVLGRDEPDIAFFRVERTSDAGTLASPVPLASAAPAVNARVAALGYPAKDPRIPPEDRALMEGIYGSLYDCKRLAPGELMEVRDRVVLHDCTTLGGNSGSLLVSLDDGKAVGLHFSGTFLTANYAVRADVVRHHAERAARGVRRRTVPVSPASPLARDAPPSRSLAASRASSSPIRSVMTRANDPSQELTVTIPIVVSIRVGAPATATVTARAARAPRPPVVADVPEESAGEEAPVASYEDREGYQANFLGEGFEVPLPTVVRGKDDVLTFSFKGETMSRLDYEHFTVEMSRSRRMCLYSAVNIDGETSRKTKRGPWLYDPRIPREAQIMKECYGPPPRFSRGHMTRREDPAWGDSATAVRGSGDSMHVTNATPQMQAFNSPIWLALEDHALETAREDSMKISVFTGPFFTKDDPTHYDVVVPTSFWKVIAFIHPDTNALCATGYEMEQDDQLPGEEAAFGDFFSPHLNRSVQVPIADIERRAGLRFGDLAAVDPLGQGEESVDAGPRVLRSLDQIRFR